MTLHEVLDSELWTTLIFMYSGPQKSDRAKGAIFMYDDNFYKNNNTFD